MGNGFEALLGLRGVMGPPEGEAWFVQTEAVVRFARGKDSATRPIILRHWPEAGPIAYVFARTTKSYSVEVANPAHDHEDEWPKCRLDEDGNIIVSRPLPVSKDALDEAHRVCSEDNQATIDAVKAARWQTK